MIFRVRFYFIPLCSTPVTDFSLVVAKWGNRRTQAGFDAVWSPGGDCTMSHQDVQDSVREHDGHCPEAAPGVRIVG